MATIRRMLEPALRSGLLLAAFVIAHRPAEAEDMAAVLLKATSTIPADDRDQGYCRSLWSPPSRSAMPVVQPIPGPDGYNMESQGVLFGVGAAGVVAPPYVQALIDAHWVRPLAFTYSQHRTRTVPPGAPPLGVMPQYVDEVVQLRGEAWVVTGPEADLFTHEVLPFTPAPPLLGNPDRPGVQSGPPTGIAPPGIRWAARLCLPLRPSRVLEWGDLSKSPNGTSEVSAYVLYHPDPTPSWAPDWRTWTLPIGRGLVERDIVRMVTYRDDGDGWRSVRYANQFALLGEVHVVGPD